MTFTEDIFHNIYRYSPWRLPIYSITFSNIVHDDIYQYIHFAMMFTNIVHDVGVSTSPQVSNPSCSIKIIINPKYSSYAGE